MAINFPSPANTNDTYTLGGKTWKFNGNAWELQPLTAGYTGSTGYTGSFPSTIDDATTSTAASGPGYMGLPQNSKSSAYQLVIGDAGKHIYVTTTATITIPANGTVAYPIGTVINLIAGSGVTITVAITTDTLYLGGTGTTGSRTIAAFGMATLVKLTSTTWIIGGTGVS